MRIGNTFLVAGAALQTIKMGMTPIFKVVKASTKAFPNTVRPNKCVKNSKIKTGNSE